MNAPGQPHVRLWRGDLYIERVPNAWVYVCTKADYETMNEQEQHYMISKAVKMGLDSSLPSDK